MWIADRRRTVGTVGAGVGGIIGLLFSYEVGGLLGGRAWLIPMVCIFGTIVGAASILGRLHPILAAVPIGGSVGMLLLNSVSEGTSNRTLIVAASIGSVIAGIGVWLPAQIRIPTFAVFVGLGAIAGLDQFERTSWPRILVARLEKSIPITYQPFVVLSGLIALGALGFIVSRLATKARLQK